MPVQATVPYPYRSSEPCLFEEIRRKQQLNYKRSPARAVASPAVIKLPLPEPRSFSPCQGGTPVPSAAPATSATPTLGLADLAEVPAVPARPERSPTKLAHRPQIVRFHSLPPVLPASAGEPAGRAPQALQHAGPQLARAQQQGVDLSRVSFLRKLQQLAKVPVAAFDLVLACVATVASFGYLAPVAVMAAGKLKQALKPQAPAPAPATPVAVSPGPAAASPVGTAVAALAEARAKLDQVKQQTRLDFARAAFVSRAIGVGVALASVGIAVAVTVASGGMAAPALVMSALLLRQAVANAHCAWRNKQRVAAGCAPLPMGANALGNAMYEHFMAKPDARPEQARHAATKISSTISLLLASSVISLGAAVSIAVPLAEKCTRLVCAFSQRLVLPAVDQLTTAGLRRSVADLERQAQTQAGWALVKLLEAREDARQALQNLAPVAEAPDPKDQAEREALVAELARWKFSDPDLLRLLERLEAPGWIAKGAHVPGNPAAADLGQRTDELGMHTVTLTSWVHTTNLLLGVAL